jgi:5-(carboxyamino)imidazole ribonucleotide mutase
LIHRKATRFLTINRPTIQQFMKPKVSIIMGSTSDLPVMEKAAVLLNDFEIPFEMNALSAHRTPREVESFASNARENGIEVIIAAAGMAAHLPGVIASMTTIPVIGVPINATLDGMDALLAIVQMPPGIPVATVGINASLNAAILAIQMLAVGDTELQLKLESYKEGLKNKIVEANEQLSKVKFKFKTN